MSKQALTKTQESRLRDVVARYMAMCDGLDAHCSRCLATQRWGGSAPLMLVDAAFMSIGLNYFTAVVPGVAAYEEAMGRGKVPDTIDRLADLSLPDVTPLWKNRRSWEMARGVARALTEARCTPAVDDRTLLRDWAASAPLQDWRATAVGAVNGVGINTYQYLRMMGGVDTSMPDKIVRRVVIRILDEAAVDLPTMGDLELIHSIDEIGRVSGQRPIELTWMTWMVQSEGRTMRMDKYRDLLKRI